jgi:hypothetical protein
LRTKSTNTRNFLLDFLITSLAILVSVTIIQNRIGNKEEAIKTDLITVDVKFLSGEIDLVQNTLNKTITGLTEKSRAAARLQSSLEEKSYRATDSLAMVVAQFDPMVIFRPELIGFDAFVVGDEVKRLKPLSTRKTLLKSMALLKNSNDSYQVNITSLTQQYNDLIGGQFNNDRSKLLNRYFLYNGKVAGWIAQYQNEINKEIQQLKRLDQSFVRLNDQLSSIVVNKEEENTED